MDAYSAFAQVYDIFMDNVPYEEWGKRLHALLLEKGIADGLLLDLGCGTGSMTEVLASFGYDMTGADASPEMLGKAMEKKEASGHDILYLLQDMREFELYGTMRAIVSACDSVNYVTEPEELLQVFRLVNNYLDPGGIFIFDFNTDTKYRMMGDTVIAEDREDCCFIWNNYYDEEERINEYDLTLFVRELADEDFADGGLYRRFSETHFQRGYTLSEIKELLAAAGLIFLEAFDGYTKNPADENSERILVIARESGKTVK